PVAVGLPEQQHRAGGDVGQGAAGGAAELVEHALEVGEGLRALRDGLVARPGDGEGARAAAGEHQRDRGGGGPSPSTPERGDRGGADAGEHGGRRQQRQEVPGGAADVDVDLVVPGVVREEQRDGAERGAGEATQRRRGGERGDDGGGGPGDRRD